MGPVLFLVICLVAIALAYVYLKHAKSMPKAPADTLTKAQKEAEEKKKEEERHIVKGKVIFRGSDSSRKSAVTKDACWLVRHRSSGSLQAGCYNLDDKIFAGPGGGSVFKHGQRCAMDSIDIPEGIELYGYRLDGTWGDHDCHEENWWGHGRKLELTGEGPGTFSVAHNKGICAFLFKLKDGYKCPDQADTPGWLQ